MTPQAKLVQAVLNGRESINHWKRSGIGTYDLNVCGEDKSQVKTVCVEDRHLAEIDQRLPALVEHYASVNTLGMVSKRKVAMNLFSHFARNNHILDVETHDAFASRADAFSANWYIHEFRGLGRVSGNPDSVWIDTICYRTERCESGFEVIAEVQKPQVKRSISWLDQHLGNATNILLLINSLGMSTAERRGFLHNSYLAVLSGTETKPLPSGVDFS